MDALFLDFFILLVPLECADKPAPSLATELTVYR